MNGVRRLVAIWLSLLLALLVFPGEHAWAEEQEAEAILHGSIVHQGIERTYEYFIPSSYDGTEPVPLLFSFHGTGWNAEMQRDLTHETEVAEREGFIAVFPNSTTLEGEIPPGQLPSYLTQWNDGREWTLQFERGIDDVGFVSALIDKFLEEYNVDERRVYATGMSNGAVFTQRLAVELSDKIAAVASVTGPLAEWVELNSDWKRPITVILIMGTDDPIVPYDWRTTQTIDYWVQRNGASAEPVVDTLPQLAEDDPTVIHRMVYGGGRYGTEIILYEVEGGGHAWPGGPQFMSADLIGWASGHMDASAVIWEHFKQHTLPGPPYSDVPWNFWGAAEIDWLTHHGVVEGSMDGLFEPNESVSRALAASLLAKAMNLDTSNRPVSGFVDVDPHSEHSAAIAAVAAEGWLEADEQGRFLPDQPLTRAETAAVLVKALALAGDSDHPFTDVAPSHPAAPSIRTLVANGLTNGYGDLFKPEQAVTKAEFSVFLYRGLTGEKAR